MRGLREEYWKWKEAFETKGPKGEPQEDKSGSEWGIRCSDCE